MKGMWELISEGNSLKMCDTTGSRCETFAIIELSKKNLTLKYNNETIGEIPIDTLASKAPVYDRKWTKIKLSEKKINIKYKNIEN